MSPNSDSQNISGSPSSMTYSDFNSDSTSSSHVTSLNSPIVDIISERRTKNRHECSTSGRTNEEPALRTSPIGSVVALGNSVGVPIYSQYGTMVGFVEHSPLLFPPQPIPRLLGQ